MIKMSIFSLAALLTAALSPIFVSLSAAAQPAAGTIGLGAHFVRDTDEVGDALEIYPQIVRTDLAWARVENATKGTYDFSTYDPIITKLIQNGVQVLLILDYNNALWDACAVNGGQCQPNIPAFTNFATAAVNHYKSFAGGSVNLWEVWNEPNNFGFPACPSSTPAAQCTGPQQYAQLLQAVYPAIHAAQSNAVVAIAGQTDGAYEYFSKMASAVHGYYDVFNYHEYDSVGDTWMGGTYTPPNTSRLVTTNQNWKAQLHPYGDDTKPMWITEFGVPSELANEQSGVETFAGQASYLTSAYNTLFPPSGGGPALVQKAFWYSNEDDTGGSCGFTGCTPQTYGLFPYQSSSKKKSAYAFKLTSTSTRFNDSGCGSAHAGQVMTQGEKYASCNGTYSLHMQTDGNLVLYNGTSPVWGTNTYGTPDEEGNVADYISMQGDGNLVVYAYGSTPTVLWSSQTYGNNGAYLNISNSGVLAIYNQSGSLICNLNGSSNLCPIYHP